MIPNTSQSEVTEQLDPFQMVCHRFCEAAHFVPEFKRGLVDFLSSPKRTIGVSFPIEMEDGSIQTFHGYRVLHSTALGPGKGGIRYHPELTLNEVRALAALMTCGNAP